MTTQHTELDAKATARGKKWELMGCPISNDVMTEAQYHAEYLGRNVFKSVTIAEQAERIMQIVLCPSCRETTPYGAVIATRMFLTIEDDVMTTFPAVGHFTCHRCGFEEFHPLSIDPRPQTIHDSI